MTDFSKMLNGLNNSLLSNNYIPQIQAPKISSIREIQTDLQKPYLADAYYERLKELIIEFEADLKPDEEVGLKLVTFGEAITIHVSDIGYYNPRIITFSGTTTNGEEVQLIQHVNQLSFLLIKVARTNPERPRIGYKLQHESPIQEENDCDEEIE